MNEDRATIIGKVKEALDAEIQREFSLKQTRAYYEMINTMATKAYDGRAKCIEANRFDLGEFVEEELEKLSNDEIGIPSDDECREMLEPYSTGLVWNGWWDKIKEVPNNRIKIWRLWVWHIKDFLSVLMNF